jgi:hypothetical protein
MTLVIAGRLTINMDNVAAIDDYQRDSEKPRNVVKIMFAVPMPGSTASPGGIRVEPLVSIELKGEQADDFRANLIAVGKSK